MGSANESKQAWRLNYELLWEDPSPEAITWVQEEFDALWTSPYSAPLSEAVIQDIDRLARRRLIHTIGEWRQSEEDIPDPAPALIEAPVYRNEFGLWEHQKYFVKLAFDAHMGPTGKARFVLADQVGLGKTIQLAMVAQLIAMTGSRPILIICPKTLTWQWQTEMLGLLDMPSAVWDGRRWIDENDSEYPLYRPEGIRRCPRRVGIVSSGLISQASEAAQFLLSLKYDCVILDEAHRARRHNLGENSESEDPDPNNLLTFMYQIAEQTRSLLLATATPVQLRPVEAWDMLDVLSRGDESVLGNRFSHWRDADHALEMVTGKADLPEDEVTRWEWECNPLPPANEHRDFAVLRRDLGVTDNRSVIPADEILRLSAPSRSRARNLFPRLVQEHNPFIRRIIRRTRQQLETTIDPETGEPFIKPIRVELLGERDQDALRLPIYLQDAYQYAEEFCQKLEGGSGFAKTLLLRRVGSSIYAGLQTAKRILGEPDVPEDINTDEEADEHLSPDNMSPGAWILTSEQRTILQRFISTLKLNQDKDPKYAVVVDCLRNRQWLEQGCIIFSQYRASLQWLLEQLTTEFPEEQIALYSGPNTSGIMQNGIWQRKSRDTIKNMVRAGELRLLLGTDAASEGLNLQRLGTLINLDLPWNPTRLEQRKGRIQRIGQINDTVYIYNLRYQGSIEDQVHQILSSRLQNIYTIFGQVPDVLEDIWVELAVGEKARAQKIIDAIPLQHPFEVRYSKVEKVDWESCAEVLSADEKRKRLNEGWE